jgi:hypothetical protein
MPPLSPLRALWRVIFPRRNITLDRHGVTLPDPLAEAKSVRIDAEEKLRHTDRWVTDTLDELLRERRKQDRRDDA